MILPTITVTYKIPAIVVGVNRVESLDKTYMNESPDFFSRLHNRYKGGGRQPTSKQIQDNIALAQALSADGYTMEDLQNHPDFMPDEDDLASKLK